MATKEIAVIGFGFSGTMSAVNLIDISTKPFTLHIVEKSANRCQGVAYSTTDAGHLLNVMAGRMGAFHERPGDFYDWLCRKGLGAMYGAESFVPRKYYGEYLREVWEEAKGRARRKGISIVEHDSEAVDIVQIADDHLVITLSDGIELTCDAAVLAIGVSPSKKIPFKSGVARLEHYIHNLWEDGRPLIADASFVEALPPSTVFAVIGSGLTMVDAVTSLVERGFKGHFCAISTNGRLSAEHAKSPPVAWPMEISVAPLNVIVHRVVAELKKARAMGADWRNVMDALRPYTVELWRHFSWEERQRFVRHLLSRWMRHRHRMPSAYQESLDVLGVRYHLIAGKVVEVDSAPWGRLVVRYVEQKSGEMKQVEVDYVLNCTGQEIGIRKNGRPLIQKIIKDGLLKVDPLGLGFEENVHGGLVGAGAGRIFVIGQLLFGSRLETIAVPELRVQCYDVAKKLA